MDREGSAGGVSRARRALPTGMPDTLLRIRKWRTFDWIAATALLIALNGGALAGARPLLLRAELSGVHPIARAVQSRLVLARAHSGAWPRALPALDELIESDLVTGSATPIQAVGVELDGPSFTLELASRNPELDATRLSYRYAEPTHGIAVRHVWVCGYAEPFEGSVVRAANRTTVPEQYLPRECRAAVGSGA